MRFRRGLLGAWILLTAGCGPGVAGHLAARIDKAHRQLAANLTAERRAVPAGDAAALARVERKYAVLDRALAEGEATGEVLPVAYSPRELAAVKDVMTTYGDLYVAPTDGDEIRLSIVPWAGYWYPMAKDDLYGSPTAPLAKLDQLAKALGQPGGTVDWEKSHHQIPPDTWEGFCSAWAVASVTSPEPTQPITYKGVTFSVADQKGLLTKVHELFPTRQFGVRYNGTADTDGTYQDLRPEAFHRLVTAVMRERHQGFVLDTDAGVEVWTKPLDRYRWIVKQDPDHADAFLVTGLPWFILQRDYESDVPTGQTDFASDVFEYRLWVDKATQRDGAFLVVAGEWLNSTYKNHPDYVLVPDVGGDWGSSNTALQQSLGVVRELFAKGMPH